MLRQSTALWVAPSRSPHAAAFGLAGPAGVIVGVIAFSILALAPGRAFAWGALCAWSPPVRAPPPDQSWLMDVPEKPGAHATGKVAVFAFPGDDVYQPVR